MPSAPLLSIVMPVFDDEATVGAAVQSALAQTLADIEIVCVDDASTDDTAAVVARFAAADPRVRLIRHEANLSAFQARRTGILAARAEHVLFLDGDDELVPDAAEKVLARAAVSGADLLGFGVTVVENDGRTGGSYEHRLQPRNARLSGDDVVRALFPVGKSAQGQLWRYLFRTRLLREAYARLPEDLVLPRVNDLPLMFLAAALATSYASMPDRLYRYHFGRGGSGHRVDSVARAEFYASAVRSVDSIRPAVEALADARADGAPLRAAYESARLSIIGYVCFQLIERSDDDILDAALAHLHTLVSSHDVVHAAARFFPSTLKTLSFHTPHEGLGQRPVRSVLLATSALRTGGVSAVLASQAHYLRESGYRVTIVARSRGSDRRAIPAGATFVELTAREDTARLEEWGAICRRYDVDVVIDHQVLYTRHWPEFALMARAEGAATIGWMHNFVGRPVYDGNDRLSLIERCSATLAHLVVLAPLDVAYFKLRGIRHVSFAPNPPSPLLRESAVHPVGVKAAPTGRVRLVWWGRLEQRIKRVRDLIGIGVELDRLGVDFDLTVIGPDWDDVTARKFNVEARRRGVGGRVAAVGPLHGQQLIDAIDRADAFVSTSIIEGYQLTIAEAQSRGLPVFMYELPWLVLVHGNEGIVSVPQGDARALARRVADVVGDADAYSRLSAASREAALRAGAHDFGRIYRDLVTG
ncbi:MAG: glycosyltransferase, partial [Microbacterium sp.]